MAPSYAAHEPFAAPVRDGYETGSDGYETGSGFHNGGLPSFMYSRPLG